MQDQRTLPVRLSTAAAALNLPLLHPFTALTARLLEGGLGVLLLLPRRQAQGGHRVATRWRKHPPGLRARARGGRRESTGEARAPFSAQCARERTRTPPSPMLRSTHLLGAPHTRAGRRQGASAATAAGPETLRARAARQRTCVMAPRGHTQQINALSRCSAAHLARRSAVLPALHASMPAARATCPTPPQRRALHGKVQGRNRCVSVLLATRHSHGCNTARQAPPALARPPLPLTQRRRPRAHDPAHSALPLATVRADVIDDSRQLLTQARGVCGGPQRRPAWRGQQQRCS